MSSTLLVVFTLALFVIVANACGGKDYNRCNSNWDCCANLYCRRDNPNWQYGVCTPTNGGGGNPGTGGAPTASHQEFNNAVTSNGYPTPRYEQYQGFQNGISKSGITSKIELAMALAQFIHESGGLLHKREIECQKPENYNCPRSYRDGRCEKHGQYYYGRGYIQLSWCYNYQQIGQDLGRGDELLYNADLVAQNEQIAWDTAFAFWKRHVHPNGEVQQGRFGASTRKINGELECRGHNVEQSRRRFRYYTNVFRAFNLPGGPNEAGCY